MLRTSIAVAFALAAADGWAAEKPVAVDVPRLVEQLGSDRFADREMASRQLDAVGARALDPLRKAVLSGDPEVRKRAEELVRRIERRVQSDKLLQPRRVRLQFTNLPVGSALEEVRRLTDAPVLLHDPQKFADRKVTVDTGDKPFWEAFDQFCEKAGIIDAGPPELMGGAGSPLVTGIDVPAPAPGQNGGGRPRVRGGVLNLVDAQGTRLPTCYAGAVRLRVLPPGAQLNGAARPSGETHLILQASAEPRLGWQGIVNLKIDQAFDDSGKPVAQATGANDGDPNAGSDLEVAPAGVIVRRAGRASYVSNGGPLLGLNAAPLRLKLKKGEREAKMLKEVSGTLTARVLTRPEPIVSVDQILKAAGKTFGEAESAIVEVTEVTQGADGQVQLRLSVQLGPGTATRPIDFPNPGTGRPADVQRLAAPSGLALLDDKGNTIPCLSSSALRTALNADGTVVRTYTLSFTPAKDQGPPTKLVMSGSKSITVDIPFTLKDVPLP